ncbi:MAG TPA: oxygenase MpaB family protein [Solirubrobacteraceae bacterium]|nr:oxygenase MpaB family protein [Solirubrobacteraceae bacterium]
MAVSEAVILSDDEAGSLLVGPDSACWRYASDARLYQVMLYPLLLQVAHPTVGAGVRDFSDFDRRPFDRLLRTLDYVSLLVYGGEAAVCAGRRLRAMHKGFRGTRDDGASYYALEPGAYAWVHATLLESYVAGHRHFGTPMPPADREAFYREYRDLGRLIGVRAGELPDRWSGFREYFDHVCATVLEPNPTVARVLASVQDPPPPLPLPDPLWRALRRPARRALWLGGIGLMAPALRERLQIPWSRADARAFQRLGRISRAGGALMPPPLRVLGPVQLRLRRRAIAAGPLGSAGAQ